MQIYIFFLNVVAKKQKKIVPPSLFAQQRWAILSPTTGLLFANNGAFDRQQRGIFSPTSRSHSPKITQFHPTEEVFCSSQPRIHFGISYIVLI